MVSVATSSEPCAFLRGYDCWFSGVLCGLRCLGSFVAWFTLLIFGFLVARRFWNLLDQDSTFCEFFLSVSCKLSYSFISFSGPPLVRAARGG